MKIQSNTIRKLRERDTSEKILGFQIGMDANLKDGTQNADEAG